MDDYQIAFVQRTGYFLFKET
ncbi:hypothetical protein E3D36_39050, partial [Burkholderia cepacia]